MIHKSYGTVSNQEIAEAWGKINELVDCVNELVQRLDIHEEAHILRKIAKPPKLAKLEMLRACLDDLEEEIRKGSI